MHSAILRGSDFNIESDGLNVSHADFFSDFNSATRLGLITRDPLDGIGAANLILAHVTAFYDRHRELNDQFHAYPEFYTFQSGSKITDYGMLDIYPIEKNIKVEDNPESILSAVIKKKINILLVPLSSSIRSEIESTLLAAVQQTVQTCYLYSAAGEVFEPNLLIDCNRLEIFDWIREITDSISEINRESQLEFPTAPSLTQRYRKSSLEKALRYF